ncbi:hypothetical protein [Photobacterium leiognathi]|uniref:hypothetical protein n=1 Tax=Photobacterium leiognathi TaxID=553611 RepID=UPI002738780F|nr:hypothetical protein [Photobacterium leiognathi]
MVNLIDNKVAKANHRLKLVKQILAELEKSNSTFKSSRKLSEYIADKMTELGESINSSTLRRANSQYKDLIDTYFGKNLGKESSSLALAKNLKLRQQRQKISELQYQLNEMRNEVKEKESEIQMLLVEAQERNNLALSAIEPPKASNYRKSELVELKAKNENTTKQLKNAMAVINKLISDADGTYKIGKDSVIDLVSEETLFTKTRLPDFFR